MALSRSSFDQAFARLSELTSTEPSSADRERAFEFASLVDHWNAKLDLTAARNVDQLVDIVFADAWLMARAIDRPTHVLDIGSGAGAPAIPLVLFAPDVRVTMVEPKQKRVAFMRNAVGTLSLRARAEVVEGRVDPDQAVVAPSRLGAFDAAMARATWDPQTWARAGVTLAPRVWVFAVSEDDVITPPPDTERTQVLHYRWPASQSPRALLAFDRASTSTRS